MPVSTRTEDVLRKRRCLVNGVRALKRVSCHHREVGFDSGIVVGSTIVIVVVGRQMEECAGDGGVWGGVRRGDAGHADESAAVLNSPTKFIVPIGHPVGIVTKQSQ